MPTSDRSRLFFVDWLKAAGISVIVIGHVAARTSDWMTPPIYPKQLGVAFFVFVTGYTLAREERPSSRVLFNRLFGVYFYGLLCAFAWTAFGWFSSHDVVGSNYLPFAAGVNVLINSFPANPSTWYIGTYLHILLFWAFALRGFAIRTWMLVAAGAIEIVIRGLLMDRVGGVLPYMILPNWLLVFLLGIWAGQQFLAAGRTHRSAAPWTLSLVVLLAAWQPLFGSLVVGRAFPWMVPATGLGVADSFVTAALISGLYSGVTWLAFNATVSRPAPPAVRFVARHSLFVFIAHMPTFYLLQHVMESQVPSYAGRSAAMLIVCLLGLSLVSEVFDRIGLVYWARNTARDWTWGPDQRLREEVRT